MEPIITTLGIGAIIGVVIDRFWGLLGKRRARFVYTVNHTQVGESADDPVFGSIRVLSIKFELRQ